MGLVDIPVIIIGGGAAGLTLSIFLSNYSVKHILFEKHPTTSLLPKAHYINQRTLEIFRQHGIADAVVAAGCPTKHMSRVDFRTGLGGDELYDSKLISHVDAFGGGEGNGSVYRNDSPLMPTNLPLLRTEPILLDIARQKNPIGILFSHEITNFVDEGHSVLVTVRKPDSSLVQYRCQYLVAADAGKVSHLKLGIKMEGPTNLACMASTHFRADLSSYHTGEALITHFMSPRASTTALYSGGALISMGPTWGAKSEEWSLHFGFPPEVPAPNDPELLKARIRELLNISDLPIEVIQSSSWVFDRVVADRFSKGRVYLVGDAVHRIPPAGGLGMNTAIDDSLNLAFKLALVLQQKAGTKLLETYEAERRPVAIRNADWGLFCLTHFTIIQAAVGLQPGNEAWNGMRMAQLFSESRASIAALHAVRRVIATQDIEFQARDVELGFRYDGTGAAIIQSEADDSIVVAEDPTGKVYIPTTRSGGRLPHAILHRGEEAFSTQDLLRLARTDFLLITDSVGKAWVEAANAISAIGQYTVGSAIITNESDTCAAPAQISAVAENAEQWSKLMGVASGGAILVRGDNFVAWRSSSALPEDNAKAILNDVLRNLCKVNL